MSKDSSGGASSRSFSLVDKHAGAGRILLLCPDEQVRQITTAMLRVLGGHDVLAVAGVLQARTRVQDYRPDLLVVDTAVPRSTDPATLALLGVRPSGEPGVPLLFLSCETRAERLAMLRSLGAHDVVIMPFTPGHLLGRVAAALARDEAAA